MINEIRRDIITGSRRFSNYFWAFVLFFGGIGFSLVGLSSYFKTNFLPFTNSTQLIFIPQGLAMLFYGTLSFATSIYILITLILDIGSGYNEYNRIENLVKIVRKGFPGKNRKILLTYPLTNIRAIGIKMTDGLNPTRSLYLCLMDERKIPLTPIQTPTSMSNLEDEAANLAKFLNLNLENL